jgi:long-chain acyl-CoA synthetase
MSALQGAPFDVTAALRGARLVVVGGTGFLGKVWLSMLLTRYPEVGKIYLVVRAKKGGDSESRFWSEIASSKPFDPVREAQGDGYERFMAEKISVLDADVTKPLCAFDPALLQQLTGTIAAVVNVAGVVDFNPPLDEALLANAFGVQNLVSLARALGDVPVLHTSTAYVAGYRKGQIDEVDPLRTPFPKEGELEAVHWSPAREIEECLDLVAQARHRTDDAFRQSAFLDTAKRNLNAKGEPARGKVLDDELARVRRKFTRERLIEAGVERATYWGWTNIYTYTKSIGEQILAASGLEYTIVRPSVIESSLAFPFPGWNEGINTMAPLVYLLMKGHIQVPAGERTSLDVIPVDMVCSGMIASLAALIARQHELVYHLGSSDTNPLAMARLVELCGLYKRRHYQRTGKGNPFVNFVLSRIEPVPVSTGEYYQRGAPAISKAARGLSGLLARAAVGPAAALLKPASKALRSYAGLAQRNGEIWELYIPFMAGTEYHFVCANMRALRARMGAEDQAKLPWAPDSLDWRFYMHDVHIPGLERWVMPQIDEKIAQPQKPLRQYETLLQMVDELADRHDLAVALQRFEPEGFTRVSFRELKQRAACTAARLAAAGVGPGDRVLLSAANHPDWPIAYFGILRAGATAVPADPALEGPQLQRVLAASKARAAIWDAKLAGGAGAEALAALGGALAALDLHEATAYDAELTPPPEPPTNPDALASVIYTSGTTGSPKGVMLTHRNFAALLAALSPVFPLGSNDRTLSVLPLHHTFEFTCGLLLPLSRGARVIYLDELSGDRMTAAMREARVTAMVGVPALWQLLERRITAEVRDLGPVAGAAFGAALSLNRFLSEKLGADAGKLLFGPVHSALGGNIRYLISGGAALPPDTARVFAGLGLPLAEGYGLTEASPVLTVAKADSGSKGGNVGKPIPGVEIKIGEPDRDGVGEVLARGPNVMLGYEGDPEATARTIDEAGWLHTGDLGKLDRRGRLVLVGRSKDVIVGANGENLYPDDIERMLGEIAGIDELCVVGIADPRGGERAACLAVPSRPAERGEEPPSQDEFVAARERAMEALRREIARLPAALQPPVVLLHDEKLPRTATRKVKRPLVRELCERLAAVSAAAKGEGKGATGSVVRAAVATVVRRPASEIGAHTRLREDLGLDSLMSMELVASLEAVLPDQHVAAAMGASGTIGELEARLGLGDGAAGAPSGEGAASTESPVDSGEAGDGAIILPDAVRDTAKTAFSLLQQRFYGDVMKPRVTGRAFIPHNRNTIVVANHTSHLDMGFVKYALGSYGRELVALAARDYFFESGAVRRTFIENFTNLAPIDRHSGLRETLREVGRLLDEGKTVLIFPEGTRSPDGQLREFKGAVGHLALRHGVDILPVYLGGAYEAMPKSSKVPTRRDLLARVGPPLEVAELKRLTAAMKPAHAARRVAQLSQRAIEELRDGGALDLRALSPEEEEAPRVHPLVVLFDYLESRFAPGRVDKPVSFYFTLGNDAEAKWTVKVGPTACSVIPGKPDGGAADCVLKTTPEMFTRIVRENYTPGVPEFMSGVIKSNDVMLLETFQKAFQLG